MVSTQILSFYLSEKTLTETLLTYLQKKPLKAAKQIMMQRCMPILFGPLGPTWQAGSMPAFGRQAGAGGAGPPNLVNQGFMELEKDKDSNCIKRTQLVNLS